MLVGSVNVALTSCLENKGAGRDTGCWWVPGSGECLKSLESPMGWDVKGIRNQSGICMPVNMASIWEPEDLGF